MVCFKKQQKVSLLYSLFQKYQSSVTIVWFLSELRYNLNPDSVSFWNGSQVQPLYGLFWNS